MKILQNLAGILCAFCLMVILLITSVEAVAYWLPGYYEKEYSKYNVTQDVQMEMEDLLHVTHEMMAYLRGSREDLHILTVINGQEREFFNAREIAHMEDVRELFLGGIALRRICIGIAVFCILLLLVTKARISQVLPRMLCLGTGIFLGGILVLAGIISTDFTRYFIMFHHIFFDNDLWILDPATDMLINIVPEPFFMDTAARIGITYGISVLVLFLVCIFYLRHQKGKKEWHYK